MESKEVEKGIEELIREAETGAPKDLKNALSKNPKAKATWEDITSIARRDWVLWIITVKQLETRKERIKRACSMLALGKRRVCCFPGPNWLRKTWKNSGKMKK